MAADEYIPSRWSSTAYSNSHDRRDKAVSTSYSLKFNCNLPLTYMAASFRRGKGAMLPVAASYYQKDEQRDDLYLSVSTTCNVKHCMLYSTLRNRLVKLT